MNFAALWAGAMMFDAFLAAIGSHRALWEGLYRLARIPEWTTGELAGRRLNLLAIAEDWCGDAANTIPFLARWADETPGVELRIVLRDQHPEVMDRYLTNGARSIPIVVVLDETLKELGHWGPRPKALQEFVMDNKSRIPKAELYPQVRKWYARDKGETTLREVLALAVS